MTAEAYCRAVPGIQRAMLSGCPGLIACRAAAPFGGIMPFDLLEKGFAAIGHAIGNVADGAAFTQCRANAPGRLGSQSSDGPEPGGGGFRRRL